MIPRGSHIFLASILLLTGFMLVAVLRTRPADQAPADVKATLPGVGGASVQLAKIEVETTELDLGLIDRDGIAHAKLRVTNRGARPLNIVKINTTCPCTMGYIDEKEALIQPGKSAYIRIEVDPFRFGGFFSRKVLTIMSTDTANPAVRVGVTARVEPEFKLVPPMLDIPPVPQGSVKEATFILRQEDEVPVEILRLGERLAETPGPDKGDILYGLQRRPEDQWKTPGRPEFEVKVTLTPKMAKGPFKRTVYLFLNLARLPAMRYEISGVIQ